MRIQTVYSDYQGSEILEDLARAKSIDVWLSNIVRNAVGYKPLNLTVEIDGEKKNLVAHGVFSDDASEYVKKINNMKDNRFAFPNDAIDIFLNMKTKSIILTIT